MQRRLASWIDDPFLTVQTDIVATVRAKHNQNSTDTRGTEARIWNNGCMGSAVRQAARGDERAPIAPTGSNITRQPNHAAVRLPSTYLMQSQFDAELYVFKAILPRDGEVPTTGLELNLEWKIGSGGVNERNGTGPTTRPHHGVHIIQPTQLN